MGRDVPVRQHLCRSSTAPRAGFGVGLGTFAGIGLCPSLDWARGTLGHSGDPGRAGGLWMGFEVPSHPNCDSWRSCEQSGGAGAAQSCSCPSRDSLGPEQSLGLEQRLGLKQNLGLEQSLGPEQSLEPDQSLAQGSAAHSRPWLLQAWPAMVVLALVAAQQLGEDISKQGEALQ